MSYMQATTNTSVCAHCGRPLMYAYWLDNRAYHPECAPTQYRPVAKEPVPPVEQQPRAAAPVVLFDNRDIGTAPTTPIVERERA